MTSRRRARAPPYGARWRRWPARVLARAVTQSARVLTAVRDSESRLRFIGYEPLGFKLFVWTLSAVLCGIAGALYVPQVGIINPGEMSTENSIEMVIWVATGGRGTLIGPIIGAGAVNGLKTWFTSVLPEFWLYALGLIFVLVTLFLPTGIVGLARRIAARIGARIACRDALPPSLPPRPGAQGMNPTHPLPIRWTAVPAARPATAASRDWTPPMAPSCTWKTSRSASTVSRRSTA